MLNLRILATLISCSSGHLGVNFLFTPYYFSNSHPNEWKLIKHNANDDADTESRRKVTVLGEVTFGFELSFVKDYQIYWLTNEHDVLNCSAVCVYQNNRIYTVPFQTYFVLIVVFISA